MKLILLCAAAAIKMPLEEEIAMVQPAEEKTADAAQHQPLVDKLEEEGIQQGDRNWWMRRAWRPHRLGGNRRRQHRAAKWQVR
jgi:hypothetical protein